MVKFILAGIALNKGNTVIRMVLFIIHSYGGLLIVMGDNNII